MTTLASRLLIADEHPAAAPRRLAPAEPAETASLLLAGGIALALAGVLDIGLLFTGARFGDAEWELGTIAQALNAMPLLTLGAVLLALGLRLRGGAPILPRLLGALHLLVGAVILASLLLFALDVPVALGGVLKAAAAAEGARQQAALVALGALKRVIAKAVVLGVSYCVTWGFLGVRLWRSARIVRAAGSE